MIEIVYYWNMRDIISLCILGGIFTIVIVLIVYIYIANKIDNWKDSKNKRNDI